MNNSNPADRQLDRSFGRLQRRLPPPFARTIGGLGNPSARWVRIPAGILLIAGGFVGFLPILGFWMVPLGLLLLAQDVPFLKRPTSKAIVWGERTWTRWKRRRAAKANAPPDGSSANKDPA